ncbi:MAG: NAD(P)/FAD-dependent oxidoreductase [Saprospiraceae bacterium]|jgi:thioredoxin reductase (NADPH)|uniref:NAD(P)/FAD-dependent oxidoreductase n=1 Tax=Candidatus Brachybacter algidus TaxID=2982024 RepID=UPI001B440CEE|nr:NAD(P)/FAD-dependent oxidoreductase [Candidatus Brachybacter algidus]MBP7304646.1 NAD(P)/FAD-dependent oxidoreductase [Saprospiraceae bacterium]MBK6372687.1 NAD(P)/FAD-dependent oxidoreductase [Candidatus Brachybacter algidus]MBK6448344.1 NAD(P)/FAD-dependent oxidoreductase [Candidatus Brachybacter algidus]MBK7605567.1 NAD(P)/FAD-dependent oxidoreductase [Candidatus Brachybacter algidus]MBK8354169.1 NAD(P)/FAD-dependent oxidoreductase [Candidatus Brachybacter algidus]
MIETDIAIIGAGPTGLFAVFEAGLLKLRCHLIDSLPQPGGQLTEIYPKKPIYDIPGYPSVLAGELVQNLMDQIAPFEPGFTLGERVEQLEKTEDNKWIITTSLGSKIKAPVVVIAAGLGSFEPRKPAIPELLSFENKGVDYIIRDPEVYRDKKLVISGGGDSALDWTVYLAELAQSITLVHRRKEFRGAPDTVDKVMDLVEKGRVELITEAEVTALNGNGVLKEVTIVHDRDGNIIREANNFIPLFGLSPKLGPIAEWGLNLDKNEIIVNTFDYQTNVPGIYAVGDINTYPGKLKLILCGFHEATLMCQSAFQYIYPDKKLSFKYTTVMGKDALHL